MKDFKQKEFCGVPVSVPASLRRVAGLQAKVSE